MAYPVENLLRRPVEFIPAGVFFLAALGIVFSPRKPFCCRRCWLISSPLA
jgi:hypothetical protein